MANIWFAYLLFYCCCLSLISHILGSSNVHGGEGATWHQVPVHSLLPAKVCSSSKASDPSKMEVVHKNGPCWSPPRDVRKRPSHQQLLTRDQTRVDSIHRRARASKSAISIPANAEGSLDTGYYIVSVGLGTPAKKLSLIIDTASDLTWVQCKPCISCYRQRDPLYDPTRSSTYRNLPCTSHQCRSLLDSPECSPRSTCRYNNSQSNGFFVQDKLTLTASDSLADFLFGCGDVNNGSFGQSAGVIGLGRKAVSLVSQATPKYGAGFSYCLPSTASSTGYLKLGTGGVPSNVQFTPMRSYALFRTFYFLNLVGIQVGGLKLPIPHTIFLYAGTLLDSSTLITRLPPSAYSVLRSTFRKLMVNYPTAPPLPPLDTCYDFTGYNNTVTVPALALEFRDRAPLNIEPSGILYGASVSQVCLAFAGNANDADVGIIGNVQQRKLNVVYDLSNKMIGFGYGGCS